MRRHGIKARGRRRYVVTAYGRHGLPIAENLLQTNCTPKAPNRVCTSDMTYTATGEGCLFLVAVIDLFCRQVLGWNAGL
jgi:transposase InsO family protein